MPKFNILCRVDAFVDYVAEIDADNAEEAARLAQKGPDCYDWVKKDFEEFPARLYVALTPSGDPIENTQIGNF